MSEPVDVWMVKMERLAESLNPGDEIKYRQKNGTVGVGIIGCVWFFDGPVVNLNDGTKLHPGLGDEILEVIRK